MKNTIKMVCKHIFKDSMPRVLTINLKYERKKKSWGGLKQYEKAYNNKKCWWAISIW